MSDSVPWGLWITIDLSSIALGAGAFTLSAVVYLFGLKRFKPIIRLAVFVGFHRLQLRPVDLGHGYWSTRSLLAPMDLLEYPLCIMGNHLVHHHLPDHYAGRVCTGHC